MHHSRPAHRPHSHASSQCCLRCRVPGRSRFRPACKVYGKSAGYAVLIYGIRYTPVPAWHERHGSLRQGPPRNGGPVRSARMGSVISPPDRTLVFSIRCCASSVWVSFDTAGATGRWLQLNQTPGTRHQLVSLLCRGAHTVSTLFCAEVAMTDASAGLMSVSLLRASGVLAVAVIRVHNRSPACHRSPAGVGR